MVGSGPAPSVYGADLWGYKIVVFDNAGAISQQLGGAAPPTGGFNKPYGLAVTPTETFVVDTTNQRVQRFGADDTFQLSWGRRGFGYAVGGESSGSFNWPRGLALTPSGTAWVADTKNNRLLEYSQDGVSTGRSYGSLGTGTGQFNWPHAVVPADNDLIVADTNNNRIVRVALSLIGQANPVVWTATGFNRPKDVTVSGNTVYVADSLNRRIVRLDATTGATIGTFGADVLHRVEGVAVAPDSRVWVANTGANGLVVFNADGTYTYTYGTTGTTHGRFNEPTKLAIQQTPNGVLLYVTDTQNDRIEIFGIG